MIHDTSMHHTKIGDSFVAWIGRVYAFAQYTDVQCTKLTIATIFKRIWTLSVNANIFGAGIIVKTHDGIRDTYACNAFVGYAGIATIARISVIIAFS
jgi:hypothetical protein